MKIHQTPKTEFQASAVQEPRTDHMCKWVAEVAERIRRWCGQGNNAALLAINELLWVPVFFRVVLPLTWYTAVVVIAYYCIRWPWRGSWPWQPPKRGWW